MLNEPITDENKTSKKKMDNSSGGGERMHEGEEKQDQSHEN